MILHLMKEQDSGVGDVTSLSASAAPSMFPTVTYTDDDLYRLLHVAYVVIRQYQ